MGLAQDIQHIRRMANIFGGYYRAFKAANQAVRTGAVDLTCDRNVERQRAQAFRYFDLPEDWQFSDAALRSLCQAPDRDLVQAWEAASFLYYLHYEPGKLYELQNARAAQLLSQAPAMPAPARKVRYNGFTKIEEPDVPSRQTDKRTVNPRMRPF